MTTASAPKDRAVRVQMTMTVSRPPQELYQFWRDFQNLPQFVSDLECSQGTGEKRSHWRSNAPAGTTIEWDAEITDDRPNEPIPWRSLESSDVDNSRSVRFERAPGGRGTEIKVGMRYSPPGDVIGTTVAKLFASAPEQLMREVLRRFKPFMETGEIARSEAGLPRVHAGQPPADTTKAYTAKA
jgi:uncharacterized membrane protein